MIRMRSCLTMRFSFLSVLIIFIAFSFLISAGYAEERSFKDEKYAILDGKKLLEKIWPSSKDPDKNSEKKEPVKVSDSKETFTISHIEARPARENNVIITFTDYCDLSILRQNLKLIPPAPLQWHNSSVSTDTNILALRGSLKAGQKYMIVLPEGLRCSSERRYKRGLNIFTVPDIASELAFLEQGSVIERNSRQMLHVRLMNVNEVMFKGLRIPPVLLPIAMTEMNQRPYRSWVDIKNDFTNRAAKLSDTIGKEKDFQNFTGKVIEDSQLFFSQKESNIQHQFSIPLSFRQAKEEGALELTMVSSNRKEQPAATPFRLYRITDIGLSYKRSEDSMLIWATSIYTGRPLKDVSLLVFTAFDEAVPLGNTNQDGLLLIKNKTMVKHASLKQGTEGQMQNKPLQLDKVIWVAAASQTDRSFIEIHPEGNLKVQGIRQTKQDKESARAVKKRKKVSAKTEGESAMPGVELASLLKGYVFTERGIYRPGETLYFKGTARAYNDGKIAPPKEASANFRIVNAKDEEVYNKDIKLSEFGTANDKFLIKSYFPLGTYTLYMKYGAEKDEVANRTFEVQEFRQPRHYVEALYKRESKKDDSFVNLNIKGEILNCEINGKYYAGGPVKHGKVRWNIYHTKTDYQRPDHPGHSFGYPLESRSELLETGESLLDENGRIVVPVLLGKEVLSGLYGIEVFASVIDFDGRASSESAVYQIEPDYLVGISAHPENVQQGDNQTLYAVVIDKKGRKVSKGQVAVQVMGRGYAYIQKRNAEGHVYWESERVWRKELAVNIPIKDDKAAFEFDFSRGGEFLVTFSYDSPDGMRYTSGTKYTVAGVYYDEQRGPKEAFERLNMTAEKPLYLPGETIKVYINPRLHVSSYLLTIERGDMIEHRTIELKPGQKTIEIPVKDAYSPNIYISLLGTVPRSSFPLHREKFDADAPTFLFGTVNVEVKGEQQSIKIGVNEEIKKIKALPGSEMSLTITSKDEKGKGVLSELAVAVVDESILSMTGFKTPSLDILAKFIAPLGVFTGELRTELLKQTPYNFFRNAPLTGGDGEGGEPEAVSSRIRKDFNPVAYFNPSVRTNEKGEAKVTFKFPDTMTTYRIYVVACDKGSRFGSYNRNALVVKDFYLEPGLPAFLTKGDKFKFFVSAFNKTDQSAPAGFSLKTDNLLSLSSASTAYPLKGYDRTLIPVEGTAQRPGVTQITFSGKFKDSSDIVELKLPVNSGNVLGTDIIFGAFKKETQVKYTFPKDVKDIKWEDINPNEVQAILTVSGSPFLRMSAGLKYLLRYPYGCVEQTSSGVFPLAGLRDAIKKGLLPDISIEETDKFIKPGIERLFSMQITTGGFGYWPGDRQPHMWGTIYAMSALTRAKLAGLELPKDRMEKALKYLEDEIEGSGKRDATFRAFASYILSLNNELKQEAFNRVYKDINNQPREAALLTLMAAKISRLLPDETVKSLLKPILERPWSLNRSDEFHARYRDPAISVLASTLVFPGEEITDRLAGRLMGGMSKEGIWSSTSDTGWALVALSEYFIGSKTDDMPAEVTVRQGEKAIGTFNLDPKSYRTMELEPELFLKNPKFTITSNNNQTLLYRVALTFPRLDYSQKGYSNGFEIHKTIKNTDGSGIIRIGDIVEVKLKINVKNPSSNYVVLDDPLPAGLVAINSAIKTEESAIAKGKQKKGSRDVEGSGIEEGDEFEDEFGEGFAWADIYWDPSGYYRFTPNFFEIRNDRVLAFRNRTWNGIYEYSYYARAVAEGEFIMPSTKVQLMYDPEVVAYTPQGKVVVKGR
ncbi:MAG: MG2 domain-containing protein [Nitrospirota bacterium]